MAKESMKAREVKRAKLAKRYQHKRDEIAAKVKSGEMPGRWCGRRAARRSLFPKESGLIWVQNPSSYVAMSRKVPPQAVTSRYVGRNEGLGAWLQISRTRGRKVDAVAA